MRALFLAVLLVSVPAQGDCPTRPFWPTDSFIDRTAETALARPNEIAALESFAFTLVGSDADRIGTRTDAVVIARGGDIVYERYARGWTADQRHYSWSVSKSVVNALAGIAVGAGLVSLADPVCKWVTLPRADHCDITIQNLLEFSSGLAWTETYEGQSNQVSSVLAMLYGEGHSDMMSFVAGHDSRDPPGATYMYSSGDTTFLAGVLDGPLRRAFGPDYAWTQLFDVLGMSSATFESDGRGTPIGSSYVDATPRDLLRFGFLYANDGCWDGLRILPEGWVAASTAVSVPYRTRALDLAPADGTQGRQLWLNLAVPEQNQPTPWPDVPVDAFAARGHWGQSITVIPSLDLVIVRTADDRDGTFDFNAFLKLAIAVGQ
jgi:CubicO group peptidase (beta-lactamase class C family)